MSRGFGRWEREIMHATAGVCVVAVSGVVRAVVPEPSRDDHASARRAAKSLAIKNEVSALYCWTCPRCGRVQDRPDPQLCCARPRSMLSICQPVRRRLVAHPAPAPGGRAPSWVNVAVMPSRLQGQLAVPTAADLAALALRRCYERVEAGAAVSAHDVVALLKLAREIERDAASQGAEDDARWQATLREVLWLARSHLGEGWKPFAADVRANQQLAAMWGPPRRSGTGPGRFPTQGRASR
jgi:hypothetical protein